MKSALAAGILALSIMSGGVALAQEPLPVIVAEVRKDHFVDRVEALGTLRANESVALTATVTERITALNFNDGARVRAGDVLVEMTSAEEHALLEEAHSTLDEAKEQYDRVRQLATRGYAPGSQLDERRREYETARARLRAEEARLSDRVIVAPFSGVVGLRMISVGALVEPGTVITTLNDDRVMKLDFSVPSTFLETTVPGLPVVAKATALGDRTFEGTVASVDNQIDPVTRSIVVRALIDNPDGILKPGLLMSVELLKNPRDVIVIPEAALVPVGRETYVYVVDGASDAPVIERRLVVAGSRRPGEVEIVKGLEAGELVVTHGTVRVRPGQHVTIRAIDRSGAPLARLLDGGKES